MFNLRSILLFQFDILKMERQALGKSLVIKQLEGVFSVSLPSDQKDLNQNINPKLLYNQEIFLCKNNFYGNVERSILVTKLKIKESINKYKTTFQQKKVNKQQIDLVRKLKICLQMLNGDTDHLLNEGILTFYIDLHDLKKDIEGKEQFSDCCCLISDIVGFIFNLLKFYFIYKEFQASTICKGGKKKFVKSLRNLDQNKKKQEQKKQQQDNEQNMLKQIEKRFNEMSVQALLDNYLQYFFIQNRNQQVLIKETIEICRICSNKIKIQNIQKHVKLCKKKSILKQNISEMQAKIENLTDSLKQPFSCISAKSYQERTDEQCEFYRIVRMIMSIGLKKQRNIFRRTSMIGVKSQKDLLNMTQAAISDYIQEYDFQKSNLRQILDLYHDKNLNEKRLSSIQLQSLAAEHNQDQMGGSGCSPSNSKSFSFKRMDEQTSSKKQHSIALAPQDSYFIVLSGCKANDRISQRSHSEDSPHRSHRSRSRSRSIISKSMNSSKSGKSGTQKHIKKYKLGDPFDDDEDQIAFATIKTKKSCVSKKKIPNKLEFDEYNRNNRGFQSLQNIEIQEKQTCITLKQFSILAFLGAGAFGKVYLAKRLQTNDLYAIKIVKISQKCCQRQLLTIRNQHQIFKKIAGDHLVRAPFSFNQKSGHIFVLEYLPGGDLGMRLQEEVYFDETKAKFYLAQIILAIQHLHKFEIIHRDLKPQNLVIDKNGHLKLTDFGLSEIQINNKLQKVLGLQEEVGQKKKPRKRRAAGFQSTKSKGKLIGTPDYIAPQIINRLSTNNFTIDWWSLGVMAYELLTGARPFSGQTIEEVLNNIQNFKIEWPEIGYEDGQMSPQAKDFIEQLLNKDFMNRLGSKGAWQLKSHPFFKTIDWDSVKQMQPPYVPKNNRLKQYQNAEEDKTLRMDIEYMIGSSEENSKNKDLGLKKFVRFDILGDQTIENTQRVFQQRANKIQRLVTTITKKSLK